MTSKSISLLVAKLDHLTSCSVSGLQTLRNTQGKPWSYPVAPSDKATGRKRGRKVILPQEACQKHYCQATLNLFRNAFYQWLKDPRILLKAEKFWSTANINSEGKVFTTGVVRDEFSNKEFQKCLGANIGRIVFPISQSRNLVYVECTFLFRKGDKKLGYPFWDKNPRLF